MKRTLSRVSAIISIVFGSLNILGALVMIGLAYPVAYGTRLDFWGWYNFWSLGTFLFLLLFGLFLLGISIAIVVVSARLLGKTNKASEAPESFNGCLIALIVLSFFGGSWITLVMAIVAICLSNEEGETVAGAVSSGVAKVKGSSNNEFEQAVARLKMYKSDGIIDDTTFKKKMDELFKKYYMSE